ncbi:MAG TPA: oligosaccharide flippase family protein, partial [Anaerolineales bacterium]|nr:oligosaccharide flippase family protein [Anaerolineales bacterium]
MKIKSLFHTLKSSPLLTGSALFFVSATVVNLGNYVFNLLMGRWLGPEAFSDVSIIVTLFLIVIFATATLQTITARYTALHTDDTTEIAILRQTMIRWAWMLGGGLFVLFGAGAGFWQGVFHTQSAWPFAIFAVGLPFYLVQGVDRGVLQGQTRFMELAASYQAEMWVRLVAGVGFALLGWGVNGAVAGIALSFLATWGVASRAGRALPSVRPLPLQAQKELLAYSSGVSGAYLGQILINNSDILIVKHFFSAYEAGEYASLALIGRVIFFATWAVVTTLFPIVARRHKEGKPHRHLLALSLGGVVVISGTAIGATWLFPTWIVRTLFGEAYLGIAPLLWLYGVATALYALGNVVINYFLSLGKGQYSIVSVMAGIAQVAVLWTWHATLAQVVWAQVILMGGMFIVLMGWGLWAEGHPMQEQ